MALLIRGGTALFGAWSPFAVRALFIVASALTLGLLAWLAAWVARRATGATTDPGGDDRGWRAGAMCVGLLLAMPMFLVAGGAANPDVPFLLLVALFTLALLRGADPTTTPPRRRVRWVLLAGLCAGLSALAKLFGGLLALPLWAVAWRLPGARQRWAGLLGGTALLLLGAAPYAWWNATRGWPTLRYHLLARHSEPAGLSLVNLGKLVGGQLAYLSPCIVVALAAAAVALWRRARRSAEEGCSTSSAVPRALLLVAGALLVPTYALIAVVPGAEPHWPSAGYLPLVVFAAAALPTWRRARPRAVRWLTAVGVAISGAFALAFHAHVLTDVGVRLMPRSYEPRYDLANELVGWPRVADAVARSLRRSAAGAVAAGCHYTSCSQLGFAARGRFAVLCPSPRLDQFDLGTPGGDGSRRRGIDVVYVLDERFPFDARELYRCARVRDGEDLRIRRGGRVVRRIRLQRCEGFAGLRAERWPPR